MRRPEFVAGDIVSHVKRPGQRGKVVCVERRGLLFRHWVYWVSWGEAPEPLTFGLWPAVSDAQRLGNGEAA